MIGVDSSSSLKLQIPHISLNTKTSWPDPENSIGNFCGKWDVNQLWQARGPAPLGLAHRRVVGAGPRAPHARRACSVPMSSPDRGSRLHALLVIRDQGPGVRGQYPFVTDP